MASTSVTVTRANPPTSAATRAREDAAVSYHPAYANPWRRQDNRRHRRGGRARRPLRRHLPRPLRPHRRRLRRRPRPLDPPPGQPQLPRVPRRCAGGEAAGAGPGAAGRVPARGLRAPQGGRLAARRRDLRRQGTVRVVHGARGHHLHRRGRRLPRTSTAGSGTSAPACSGASPATATPARARTSWSSATPMARPARLSSSAGSPTG